MKCRTCGGKAAVELPQHKMALCGGCYPEWVRGYVARTVKKFRMLAKEDRVLVAVSGGKDSLSLWDILHHLGYETTGLYIDLGIHLEGYSGNSRERAEAFARGVGRPLLIADVKEEQGVAIPDLRQKDQRIICSGCGMVKRHYMNRVAGEKGFTVVATGHNLDDEAASLFGNVLGWRLEYLSKQAPVAPARGPKLVRKVKPLCYLSEREMASYAFLSRIPYVLQDCPFSVGASSLSYKDLLNRLELAAPGTKRRFYDRYLATQPIFASSGSGLALRECDSCGMPTSIDVCSFCRTMGRVRLKLGAAAP